jgi:hypothetical protein
LVLNELRWVIGLRSGLHVPTLTYVLYPGMMLGYIYTYKLVLKEAVDALQVEYRAVRIYVHLGYMRHLDRTDVLYLLGLMKD